VAEWIRRPPPKLKPTAEDLEFDSQRGCYDHIPLGIWSRGPMDKAALF
jgi:hypothetical protein